MQLSWPTNSRGWNEVWGDITQPADYFSSRSAPEIDHRGIAWNLVRISRGRDEMKRQIEADEEPTREVRR